MSSSDVIVIGGGPAGLIAAETLARAGHRVSVYERKPSPGRKFLMAGRGGLNLTHSEPLEKFMTRYSAAQEWLERPISRFTPADLRAWCEGLGQNTFVGSSGRVFPKSFKASPLLRAWIGRLEQAGVNIILQREWVGWDDTGGLLFKNHAGEIETLTAAATLLALGGASWPRLGADGSWVDILKATYNIPVTPLVPANCGFVTAWSPVFRDRFAGQPLKNVTITFDNKTIPGDIIVTQNGIEGGAVYALSSLFRDEIAKSGKVVAHIDLRPHLSTEALVKNLSAPRGRQSFSTWLQKSAGLSGLAAGLLREDRHDVSRYALGDLAALIKAVPLTLIASAGIERAISTAGGIPRAALDENFMLKDTPGVFAAGEMLDWEAPTGGYLLQACFATGVAAAEGIINWLAKTRRIHNQL
jgi:uncharacterized flavoprotein (TIGR03862 family)